MTTPDIDFVRSQYARKVAELGREDDVDLDSVLSATRNVRSCAMGGLLDDRALEMLSSELDVLTNELFILRKEDESKYRKMLLNDQVLAAEERLEKYLSQFHDEAELIGILQAEAGFLGETPTGRYFEDRGLASRDTFRRYFGSYNNAVWRAGLEPNQPEYGKDEMAHLARTLFYEEEEAPTANDLQKDEWMPDKERIRNEFGSFGNFLSYAGLLEDYMVKRGGEENVYDREEYEAGANMYFDQSSSLKVLDEISAELEADLTPEPADD